MHVRKRIHFICLAVSTLLAIGHFDAIAEIPGIRGSIQDCREINGKLFVLTDDAIYGLEKGTPPLLKSKNVFKEEEHKWLFRIVGGGANSVFMLGLDPAALNKSVVLYRWTDKELARIGSLPSQLTTFWDARRGACVTEDSLVVTLDSEKWLKPQLIFVDQEKVIDIAWVSEKSLVAVGENGTLSCFELDANGRLRRLWSRRVLDGPELLRVSDSGELWVRTSEAFIRIDLEKGSDVKKIDSRVSYDNFSVHGKKLIAWGPEQVSICDCSEDKPTFKSTKISDTMMSFVVVDDGIAIITKNGMWQFDVKKNSWTKEEVRVVPTDQVENATSGSATNELESRALAEMLSVGQRLPRATRDRIIKEGQKKGLQRYNLYTWVVSQYKLELQSATTKPE